ncbi:hypothetical protein GOU96_17460 [Vibrio sp. R-1]|uniref:hypothetical protein n=1 Tax=Vibrio sp. R-1 TaxID=2682542 RepID=UPI002270DEE5|nr:hypothetical protein [Vibrio sp. R-1]MCX9457491.1 hypothetical protein [Vibrio cholerae]MEB3778380.1 hypothetical protein [Vibrio sp. R-1]
MNNLEALILKYRTNEMMRLIFHIEDLRKYLIGSMKASNYFINETDERYFDTKAKVMPQIWTRLLSDGILSADEITDLKNIIDIRNTIAHEVYKFTQDLKLEFKDYAKHEHFKLQYDYTALERLLCYKNKIQQRWNDISEVSMRSFHFSFADSYYEQENCRLSKRIDKLYNQRDSIIDRVNQELASVKFDNYKIHPKDKNNFLTNGSLSSQGTKICRNLLQQGLSKHTVSVLMDIPLRKVNYQNRKMKGGLTFR